MCDNALLIRSGLTRAPAGRGLAPDEGRWHFRDADLSRRGDPDRTATPLSFSFDGHRRHGKSVVASRFQKSEKLGTPTFRPDVGDGYDLVGLLDG